MGKVERPFFLKEVLRKIVGLLCQSVLLIHNEHKILNSYLFLKSYPFTLRIA